MWGTVRNVLNARRDKKELKRLHMIIWGITQVIKRHTTARDFSIIVRVGARIRGVLEAEAEELDLEDEARFVETMRLERLDELAQGMDGLATEVGRLEDEAPVIALRLLAGWLKSNLIARRSTSRQVIQDARKLEDLYLFHVKNSVRVLRGEPLEN